MGIQFEILKVGPSVGEVAGFISGGLSLLHQALPLTFAIILIALIYKKEYNAPTWSALSRHIQKSILPTIIRADGGISRTLSSGVFIISTVSLVVAVLLPLASFLTPIPLTDKLVAGDGTTLVDFEYVPDLTLYGQATPPRPSSPIKRACDHGEIWGDCPNSKFEDVSIRTKYPGHIVVNSTIPDVTIAPYRSHSMASTVAGPLQIQYRNWYEGNYTYVDNLKPRVIGNPRAIQSFVLQDGYHLVEGLIVDAADGGIGFRNHTIPAGYKLGAEWEEDILWITPMTACSATNLSLHFSISRNAVTSSQNGYLKNDGGFSALDQNPPVPRWDDENDLENNWRAIGYPPDLQNRADVAAFWNNRFVAQALAINSSQVGQTYTDQLTNYGSLASPSSLVIGHMDGNFINNNFYVTSDSNSGNFTAYGARCGGYDEDNPSTTTKAYVRCGYLYSVPTPLHEDTPQGQSQRFDLGSDWTQQLYTCASSTKASIKTVSFRFNGTHSLAGLKVLDVKDKDYTDTPLPRWAVENAWGFGISDINPFWGLTDDDVVSNPSLTVYEAEEIYLPATTRGNDYSSIYDSFAAGAAAGLSWNSVYGSAAIIKGTSLRFIPSYSGESNYAQTLKWRQLSRTQEGAAKILNLIWSDLMASAVVGTVTGFETASDRQNGSSRATGSAVLGRRAIHPLIHKIGYSNIYFAIPAFLLGIVLVLAVLWCLIFLLLGRLSLRRLEYYTNQTSLGRALAQLQHPGTIATDAPTSEWKKKAANLIIHVPRLPRRRWRGKASLLSSAKSVKSQSSNQSFAMSALGASSGTAYQPVHTREEDVP